MKRVGRPKPNLNSYSKIALIAFGLLAPDLALAQAQRPTATEVFQLRSECAKLGKEFQATFKDTATSSPVSYNTNYDPETMRCYFMMRWLPLGKGGDNKWELYDGQTRGLLGESNFTDKSGYLNGHPECTGWEKTVKCFGILLGVDLL
jgi:hypothetical protein